MKPELLRALPKMDLLLARPALAGSPLPYALRRQAARQVLDEYRAALRAGALSAVPGLDELEQSVLRRGAELSRPALGRVINATGVVLHTNLGRAPLSPRAAAAVGEAARGYSNLEYDLSARRRGRRGAAVEALLCALTGAEAALVVNNNAAAVFLLLSALAAGRGVAISRGELVEIGGGFRVPDILARSGARLVEVGTTNKTRPADYAAALDAGEAQVLLKVHPSNFRVVGFTQAVSLPELGALARERGVPLFCDLGSAAPGSPELAEAVAWADVCCFSGDKLLGAVDQTREIVFAASRDQCPGEQDAYYASMSLGVWEPLITKDESGKPAPALATEWEHNEDSTVWTFHLRPGGRRRCRCRSRAPYRAARQAPASQTSPTGPSDRPARRRPPP